MFVYLLESSSNQMFLHSGFLDDYVEHVERRRIELDCEFGKYFNALNKNYYKIWIIFIYLLDKAELGFFSQMTPLSPSFHPLLPAAMVQ